ncbi:MAG TPA: hypothetical protein VG602_08095 [Actinomycetota bacterium]|nr:hypothetical protein [Actinomycetota bacterium]
MRRSAALATVLAMWLASPDAAPARRASPQGHVPSIYRIRVVVSTAAPFARVSLDDPAVMIEGRRTLSRGPGTVGVFDGFGGAVRVTGQGTGRRPSTAGFVVAVSPLGARRLRFVSAREGRGRIEVAVHNLNDTRPVPLASVVHRRGATHAFTVPLPKVTARGPAPRTAPLPPKTLAFYYAWYRGSDWIDGSKPTARYNVNPDPYDSADPRVIDRHFAQADVAKLDGFIVSWWGRDTPSDHNLPALLARVPKGFEIALYLEVQGHRFRTPADIIGELDYALDRYGSSPHYLRVGGRPVVYVYSSKAVLRGAGQAENPDYRLVWHEVVRGLRARGHRPVLIGDGTDPEDLSVFGGLHTYGTTLVSEEAELERRMALTARAYSAVHGGRRRIWASSVFPGYDDRHMRGPSRQYVPRDGGAFYAAQWWTAVAGDPDQVVVVSFNEWPETTNIEPNLEWQDHYLQLTAQWASRYRRSR